MESGERSWRFIATFVLVFIAVAMVYFRSTIIPTSSPDVIIGSKIKQQSNQLQCLSQSLPIKDASFRSQYANMFPLPKFVASSGIKSAPIRLEKAFEMFLYGYNEDGTIVNSVIHRYCNSRGFHFDQPASQPSHAVSRIIIQISNCSILRKQLHELTGHFTDSSEIYRIHVHVNHTVTISVCHHSAIYNALSSLNQLFYSPTVYSLPLDIIDWPDRRWRGLMLDVARHFIPLSLIYRTIDGMEAVHMNILHLHLTDSQSFPIFLRDSDDGLELSKLALQGAFSRDKIYSLDDLRSIVHYAQARGIEVIPEIDMPAHALSWGKAFKDVVVRCEHVASRQETPQSIYPLDPSQNMTFRLIEGILRQVSSVFTSPYLHIGGDEVNEQCWAESKTLMAWATENGIDRSDITKYFERRVLDIVRGLRKTPIVWQGVLDADALPADSWTASSSINSSTGNSNIAHGRALQQGDQDTPVLLRSLTEASTKQSSAIIVEPWKCWSGLAVRSAIKAVSFKHPLWMAACYYLDANIDWTTYLLTDQLSVAAEQTYHESIQQHEDYFVGSEGALWTEHVDHTNFECRLWPRAAAIAHSLWGFSSAYLTRAAANHSSSNATQHEIKAKSVALTVDETKALYSSFAIHRQYLVDIFLINAAPLVFHYPERILASSRHHRNRHRLSSTSTQQQRNRSIRALDANFEPIFPRNLTRILQLIDALDEGVVISSDGPKTFERSGSSHHYLWITAQCLGIPEAIQRPLYSYELSFLQLNIADGSVGARGENMLTWFQQKAMDGVMFIGLCELVNWGTVNSKTDIVRNVPMLLLRAAQAGYVHAHMTHQTSQSSYPVGIISIFPFEVLGEYQSPDLQRCAIHVLIEKLQLHVWVVHLHAHDAVKRAQEAVFLTSLLRPLIESNKRVIVMGDFNTLSPYDAG